MTSATTKNNVRETNHRGLPPKSVLFKSLSVFLLSTWILACSHMPSQQEKGTAQTPPVPEYERNLSKENKVKEGANASSQTEPSKPTPKQAQPSPARVQDSAKPATPAVETGQKSALPSPPPPLRVTEVAWATVNLREGPGMNHKVIGTAKKGTRLQVFEDRGSWLRAGLDDGKEVWVSKSATPDTAKTSSPPASAPPPNPSSSSLKRAPSKPASPM